MAFYDKERANAKTFGDLKALAKKRGYGEGWAWNIYKSRVEKKNQRPYGN